MREPRHFPLGTKSLKDALQAVATRTIILQLWQTSGSPSRRGDGPGQLLGAHTEYLLTKKSGAFSFMILEEFGGWRGESQC